MSDGCLEEDLLYDFPDSVHRAVVVLEALLYYTFGYYEDRVVVELLGKCFHPRAHIEFPRDMLPVLKGEPVMEKLCHP